jgi:tetratricopeptide (TPR) repeat protein
MRLSEYAAVQLFAERAAACADFAMTDEVAPAVAQVCVRLDGIPLALELAAARVRVLDVHQLASRLDDRLALLTAGRPAAPGRQRTLRAAIDWSYDLLSTDERRLFARLAVFAGGWTLDAAESICVGQGITSDAVLDLLGRLVDKSLALTETEPGGTLRFSMLATLRQYAGERMREAEEEAEFRRRHATWFLHLAERAEEGLWGSGQSAWLDQVEAELDNMRAAIEFSLTQDGDLQVGLTLAYALWRFWDTRGRIHEGLTWLKRVLGRPAASERTVGRGRALAAEGYFSVRLGDYETAVVSLEESLDIARQLGDLLLVAGSFNSLGLAAHWQGEHRRAEPLFAEALRLYRQLGRQWGIANVLFLQAEVAMYLCDFARATTLHEESLALKRQLGDEWSIGYSLVSLGVLASRSGDHVRSTERYRECLMWTSRLGDLWVVTATLTAIAVTAIAQGRASRAAALFAAAQTLREQVGIALPAVTRLEYDRALDAARDVLGEQAFGDAYAAGRDLALEEAVAFALGDAELPAAS